MSARLVAVSGSLAGEVVALAGAPLSIGRGTANNLAVADLGLSRLHCLIQTEQGRSSCAISTA